MSVLGMQVFLDTYATEGIRRSIAQEALDAFAPDVIRALINTPGHCFVVAELNQHLVGFTHITAKTDHVLIANPDAAELKRLYIQERFTRRGIGWQLLRHAVPYAWRLGAQTLWATSG
jgi:GNAT superfamily N-acetyltransferase